MQSLPSITTVKLKQYSFSLFSVEKPRDDDPTGMIDGVNDGNESNEYDEEEENCRYRYTHTLNSIIRMFFNVMPVCVCVIQQNQP